MAAQKIGIIGGGRWARTIAVELDRLLSNEVNISMHSPSNADGLRRWVIDSGIKRIKVDNQWPRFDDCKPFDAVIVANQARFHFPATASALLAGTPALVEKPFALTAVDAKSLVDMSKNSGALLCAGHVFLFSRDIQIFADHVVRCGSVQKIDLTWSDPATEIRHGEQKRYDPSISVIHDVFPHILSLLRVITSDPVEFKGLALERGGARVKLDLQVGISPCVAILERNAPERRRVIQVETTGGSLELDFTTEPAHIRSGDAEKLISSEWRRTSGSLSTMLKTFLEVVALGKCFDERLSPAFGLEAGLIIDQAAEVYCEKQGEWLSKSMHKPIDDELRYALTERSYSLV